MFQNTSQIVAGFKKGSVISLNSCSLLFLSNKQEEKLHLWTVFFFFFVRKWVFGPVSLLFTELDETIQLEEELKAKFVEALC